MPGQGGIGPQGVPSLSQMFPNALAGSPGDALVAKLMSGGAHSMANVSAASGGVPLGSNARSDSALMPPPARPNVPAALCWITGASLKQFTYETNVTPIECL